MGNVFVFSLTSALNPSLLAAVTVMLTLPSPKRLLLGYLVGAVLTSVTCGLLLVFLWPGSSTASTAKHTVNPIIDLTLGTLILLLVIRIAARSDHRSSSRDGWPARVRSSGRSRRRLLADRSAA